MSEANNPLGLSSIPSVSSEGLFPIGRRTSLKSYVVALWGRRHFIIAESRAKVSGLTKRNILGYGWLFLNPLLSVIAFWFIFGFILGASRGIPNFVGYLVIGVFFFQFTGKTMTSGIAAIRNGAPMIKGFQFPRAALPISIVVRNFLDFIPSVLVMTLLLLIVPPAEVLTWRVFLVPAVVVLQTMFNVGLACLLARIGHMIPDISNLVSVFSRFWLYGSGVFFSIDVSLAGHPLIMSIMQWNPMYAYLKIVRNSLLYGLDSSPLLWTSAVLWAVCLLIGGFVFFWRGEESYGR